MIANQLMSDVVPVLRPGDYCKTALNWMEVFRLSHLPIVENKRFKGLVSDTIIYDANYVDQPVSELDGNLMDIKVQNSQHLLEIIEIFHRYQLTALPVVKEKNFFSGLITLPTLIDNLSELLGTDSPGGIIIVEVHVNNYTLSEIAQIVESNDTKILACYVTNIPDSMRMQVTLKLNESDLTSVIRTFERYEYDIKASFSEEDRMTDVIQDRYDSFMKYLNL